MSEKLHQEVEKTIADCSGFTDSDLADAVMQVVKRELQAEREKSKQQFDLGYKHGVREGRGAFKSNLAKEKETEGE